MRNAQRRLRRRVLGRDERATATCHRIFPTAAKHIACAGCFKHGLRLPGLVAAPAPRILFRRARTVILDAPQCSPRRGA